MEKIDQWTVRFTLKKPYAPFLVNATLGILPKHIWEKIDPAEFPLAPENFNPIGTGPFRLKKISRSPQDGSIKTIILEKNSQYYLKSPYLREVIFKFYSN